MHIIRLIPVLMAGPPFFFQITFAPHFSGFKTYYHILTKKSVDFFTEYVSSNRWHFFLFIDVSLFLLFSDNSF